MFTDHTPTNTSDESSKNDHNNYGLVGKLENFRIRKFLSVLLITCSHIEHKAFLLLQLSHNFIKYIM